MENVNDSPLSSREDNPEMLIKTYEKMIADDLKRIEEEGGADADHLKACLYEKWVPELLDTISMLCKTTSELEQVSTNAVIQLDHKLQESASATRAFMQRSAEMDACFYKNPLSYPSNTASSLPSSFQNYFIGQNNGANVDVEGNSLLSLQTQLAAAQQSLEESKEHNQEHEKTVKKLQDKLAKREVQLDNLLKNQPIGLEEEKTKLKEQLAEKNAELQKVLSQKRMFEKRASDREDKIKALTLEVASKHDVVCQLEERLRQAQQRDDQHQMQLNYQGMLLEALRKELKKYKKAANSTDDKISKDTTPSATANEQKAKEQGATYKTENETCHTAECTKSQDYVRLERRLEELEMMLRAKDDMISKMSSDVASSSRSQPVPTSIQQMTPEELKRALVNKEKEIEEQRVLISQLQDALVASKHKLEELQRSPESGADSKDEIIKSLQQDLSEMESQYAECFTEVCKQNQQLILLRQANQHYQQMSERLLRELQKTSPLPDQETATTANQLADATCELAFAKAQLSIYKTKNTELLEELQKLKSTKSFTEQQIENYLSGYKSQLSENETLSLVLKENLNKDNKLTEEILSLQACVNNGAVLLHDKDLQITLLQEKLNQMCDEGERQLKLMRKRDITLAELAVSLDKVNKEKEILLNKISSLESQHSVLTNLHEKRSASSESSIEKCNALEEELRDVKQKLQLAQQELKAWKQRYDVINTNLLAKEKKIQSLKSELKENRDNGKLQEAEKQLNQLRIQLEESEKNVTLLRNNCEEKEKTITALKAELEDEIKKSETEKMKSSKLISEVEQQVCTLRQEISEITLKYENREQELEAIYKEKDQEMQRLISISCENVESLQQTNAELMDKLKESEQSVSNITQELEDTKRARTDKLEELAEARRDIEIFCKTNTSLQEQLQLTEAEVAESKERLGQFENELVLSSEKVLQLQAVLNQAQQERQEISLQLSEARSELSARSFAQQQQLADLNGQLQTALVEKEHLERSQEKLEEMCKSLTVQLGGQRNERDRAVRGLRQAAAERTRLCQEARQVLTVAREWLAEHRASALEMQQLRAERDHLLKENMKLRHRRGHCTSLLNPWDCGLVDREESGFWSSHWTTQLGDHRDRDEDWADEEEIEEVGGCRGGDIGYQSGGSSK